MDGPTQRKGSVLLVEDEWVDILYASRPLERASYEVLVARTADQAVDVLREKGDTIDCVLVDLELPDPQGNPQESEGKRVLEFLRTSGVSPWAIVSKIPQTRFWEGAQERRRTIRTPCCAVISHKPESDGRHIWPQCYSYIEKPYEPNALVGVVDEMLRKRERRGPSPQVETVPDVEANAR